MGIKELFTEEQPQDVHFSKALLHMKNSAQRLMIFEQHGASPAPNNNLLVLQKTAQRAACSFSPGTLNHCNCRLECYIHIS